jgi:hypothetical protein
MGKFQISEIQNNMARGDWLRMQGSCFFRDPPSLRIDVSEDCGENEGDCSGTDEPTLNIAMNPILM